MPVVFTAGEEAPVEAGVAQADRAVAGIVVEIGVTEIYGIEMHGRTLIPRQGLV